MTAKNTAIDTDYLIREYLGGKSEYALALELGVSRTPIRRILLENGIAPRSHSDAGLVRAGQMSPGQRRAQASAAHMAATGRKKTVAEQCLTAQTRQERGLFISARERQLAVMLAERGIEVIHQQAIGPYNCDLGAAPVAVEVYGGNWHWSGDHRRRVAERFNYILNAGWHILVIPATNISPLTSAVADYVVAYIETARRDPTRPREYRVVWRAGEFVTVGGVDGDNIAIEPPFTSRRDPVTGRYTTVAN